MGALDPPLRRSGRAQKGDGVWARLENLEKALRPDLYTSSRSTKTKGVKSKAVEAMPTNPMAPAMKTRRRPKVCLF
jgi:hypothetical protein